MSGIRPLKVRAAGNDMKVAELSGGNQQKVVIANLCRRIPI
jgi:ABC-type sugar transport system ATPase subunit